jgi:tetratricopeptide (TPR) repeat protein
MVRMRARIAEEDDEATARAKLDSTLSEHVLDADERAFVEPKLAHLIGLGEEGGSHERHDLFAAWRLFFERLAATYPTVLVFEDMHWADSSLLDFVEYMLDWSRSSALFVVTHARPELLDRRPGWGSGHRNFTSLHLGALPDQAMVELLEGFVPGLPDDLRAQILARAEGVPLYAVETVRMLLDRGLLVQEGPVYRPTGDIATLAVPETLHGLVASRLDGLPDDERRLLQDGAVVGKTFTAQAVAAVGATSQAEIEPLLSSLVRKEILGVQADPTSPEHGQYGFLQDLVRHVAYETLSRRERRARHVAAAEYLAQAFANEAEVAEVVASHYVEAHAAQPDADDAPELRGKARDALVRAGDRAESLGATSEARRYLETAADLAVVGADRAALLERAGWLARYTAEWETADRLLSASLAAYEGEGDVKAAARVSGRIAATQSARGLWDDAMPRAEAAFATLESFEPGPELATLASRLATGYVFLGQLEKAAAKADFAVELAERLGDPEALGRGLNALALVVQGSRPEEATALWRQQLMISREHSLYELEYNGLFSLSDLSFQRDRYDDALTYLEDALALARRRGSRTGEWAVLSETTYPLFMRGRWNEALERFAEVPEDRLLDAVTLSFLSGVLEVRLRRGEFAEARRILSLYESLRESPDVQNRGCFLAGAASVALADGRLDDAVRDGVEATRITRDAGFESAQSVKQGLVEAIEAALALGDTGQAEKLVASIEAVPPGLRSGYLDAQAVRFRGRLAGAPEYAAAAAARFRELRIPFWLGVALLEHGELTGDESSLAEAREIFEGLGATPWLERLVGLADESRSAVPA